MTLRKITEKGGEGNLRVGESEVFIVSWNNRANPDFFTFDASKTLKQIDKEHFAVSIIGKNYKKIEDQLPSNIESYQATKDEKGNTYFCFYQEGVVHGFDKNGNKFFEWVAEEVSGGHPIYDIKYQYPDFLWIAFPTGQTVTQVSISKKKEVFKIGEYSWDDKYEPLSYPESIFVTEEYLYIPNMGNSKLFRLELATKKLELVRTFEERIWQYEETTIGTFVITDTGIYEIEE
ncbi:MAG: hypothetical protein AB8B69_26045 [Chitinophagales bacterium]